METGKKKTRNCKKKVKTTLEKRGRERVPNIEKCKTPYNSTPRFYGTNAGEPKQRPDVEPSEAKVEKWPVKIGKAIQSRSTMKRYRKNKFSVINWIKKTYKKYNNINTYANMYTSMHLCALLHHCIDRYINICVQGTATWTNTHA